MRIFSKLLTLVVFLFIFLIAPKIVLAADLNIECFGTGTCIKSGLDPLFSQVLDGYFLPGISVSKTVQITNSAPEARELFIKSTKIMSTGNLEDVMEINLYPSLGGTPFWNGSLTDFYSLGDFSLGVLSSHVAREYTISARMKPEADNYYQGRTTKFDLNFLFWMETAGPTPTPGGSDGGDGGNGGGGGPVGCNDALPGKPTNLTVIAGPNIDQATLSWTKVAPYTSFLLAYSDVITAPKWGNPDIGNVNTFVVSGLGSGTYYFWVRGQNGCQPGLFAGPVNISLSGPITFQPAAGFLEGVLGESTPSAQVEGISGGILGEDKVKGLSTNGCGRCIWWQILLGEAIVLLIFYKLILKKHPSRKNYLLSILIPVITYIIFLLLNRNCLGGWFFINSSSFFCKYFWLFDLILFLLMIIFKKINSLQEKTT